MNERDRTESWMAEKVRQGVVQSLERVCAHSDDVL